MELFLLHLKYLVLEILNRKVYVPNVVLKHVFHEVGCSILHVLHFFLYPDPVVSPDKKRLGWIAFIDMGSVDELRLPMEHHLEEAEHLSDLDRVREFKSYFPPVE